MRNYSTENQRKARLFIKKSKHNRQVELVEAYETLQRYRTQLIQFLKIGTLLTQRDTDRVVEEIMEIGRWLRENRSKVVVYFPLQIVTK